MSTISLCMIVKNEENTLGRCLSSVREAVDEIIIVDTGSTDRTKEVAAAFTEKIFDFTWIDDFSAARNYSFAQATQDYLMWLDADDIVLPEDLAKLKQLKSGLEHIDAVMMKYNIGFDQQGNVTFSFFRERLVKRSLGCRWREPVHEYLEVSGRSIQTEICITHAKPHRESSDRNLRIYENILARGEQLSARGRYYYARELKDHARYRDAVRMFHDFLDSGQGWVEDNITACGELALCYQAIKDDKNALLSLLFSFNYDKPRAEACCQIGYYFKERAQYRQAVFWFELTLTLEKPHNPLGFIQPDCWGFIPCMECVVCYDKLGDRETARRYNEQAAQYKPDSPAVLYNQKYFAGLEK